MKILLGTTAATLNGGGIGSYNVEFCNIFRKNSDLHLLTNETIDELDGYAKVISLGHNPLRGYKDYKDLIERINNENFDVIFNSDSSELAIIAPFLFSPIVTVSHTFNNLPAIRAGYNHKYLTNIIALSKAGKTYLEYKFNIKNTQKIVYLYNFVHHDLVASTTEKENKTVLNIVYPGGAIPMKYPEMVVEAVNMLAKTDLNFNLYWYGNDLVPLRRLSLPKRICDLVITDNRIHIKGKVCRNESLQIIDSANIFLLPSRAEGCPVSLMEAMCTGCIPIVGNRRHVCREILEDGDFGIIVKQGSSIALYKAIVNVISNPGLFRSSYRNSLVYSNEVLSEEKWHDRMMEIFVNASNAKKEYISLTFKSFQKSRLLFSFYAMEKILVDKLLSLSVFCRLNYIYVKNRIHGIV